MDTDIPGNLWDIRNNFWKLSHRLSILLLGFRQSVMQAVHRLLRNIPVISWVTSIFTNDKVLHPGSQFIINQLLLT